MTIFLFLGLFIFQLCIDVKSPYTIIFFVAFAMAGILKRLEDIEKKIKK